MRSCLAVVPDVPYVTWHVAVEPVPNRLQGEPVNVKEPTVLLLVNTTVPLGVIGVPDEVS